MSDSILGRRILVTGASGFIGTALVPELLEEGAEVIRVARHRVNGYNGVQTEVLDLTDSKGVNALVARLEPQIVVHLAGHVDNRNDPALLAPTFSANVIGTFNLLSAAAEMRCERVILTSSGGILSKDGAQTPYAVSKAVVEMYGRAFHSLDRTAVTCIRPFLTYGPGQASKKLIPYTILSFLNDRPPIILNGAKAVDLIYVADVVRGIARACGANAASIGGTVIDLGTGRHVTIRDVVATIRRLLGARVVPSFTQEPTTINEASEISVAELSGGRSLLGWEPHWTLEHGLRQTIQWYANQHSMSSGAAVY
jgi:UDP-glucose 4-epimerase